MAIITGTLNQDTLEGLAEDDIIQGLDGDDVIRGLEGDDIIQGNQGDDKLFGGEGDDVIQGNEGNDHIEGNSGNDILQGGAGNDFFIDTQGTNYFDGGEGYDTVSLYGLNSGIQLNLAQESGSYLNEEGQQITQTFLGIERVNATIHNDHLTGNQEDNTFYGYEGDDTYFGGAGNDTFVDTQGTNYFDGGEGYDSVNLHGFNSGIQLNLAQESGSYIDGEGQQITQTFLSIERVHATIHDDNLTGNQENNDFYGYEGDDSYFGGAGNDTFVDYQGTNYFDGGEDYDTVSLYGLNSGIQLNLAQESGSYLNEEGQQITQTFLSIERIHATIHDDNLTGNQENNDFYGYEGDDSYFGGAGNDTFVDYQGTNYFDGGEDYDTVSLYGLNSGIQLNLAQESGSYLNEEGQQITQTFLSIERIHATIHDDNLTGNQENNDFYGYEGDDSYFGG
ncbi:MAG: calcium-binding protein, partial [Symploca sp. SIO1C4]|nr:calcium-binding protein [Symploca sp. SIO1C4]